MSAEREVRVNHYRDLDTVRRWPTAGYQEANRRF